jgi:acyl-CoA synthetase (AMP-forming)/AMP-acid ligase II
LWSHINHNPLTNTGGAPQGEVARFSTKRTVDMMSQEEAAAVTYNGAWTMGAIIAAKAAEQPTRRAVQFEATAVTYAEWDAAANQVANALLAEGLERQARVAVMLTNQPEFLAAWGGVAKAGLVEVPVNTATGATCWPTCSTTPSVRF